MPPLKTLMLGAALLSFTAAPALAGDHAGYNDGGWGGRYNLHESSASSESQSASYGGSSYEASGYRGGGETADGGYHSFGGGYSRSEETSGSWSYRRMDEGATCRHLSDRDDGDHHHARRLPLCSGEGEVSLQGGFFYDAGGVGGFPEVFYGGGGGGGGGFADAGASASASASASVSVRFRGGHHGGHMKGGCGCGGHHGR